MRRLRCVLLLIATFRASWDESRYLHDGYSRDTAYPHYRLAGYTDSGWL